MKLTIDSGGEILRWEDGRDAQEFPLYSPEAFRILSLQWLKLGWSLKYSYTFSWLGRPIIQLPEDVIRAQEAIVQVQPDVIVETGIAHGGSLVLFASVCAILGRGRVIGVDIQIRPENRTAIENHALARLITLIEGDSVHLDTIARVRSLVKPDESVMVILDSNHSKEHVLAELEAYHGLVTPGSYIVATDGIMKDLNDVPRGKTEWIWDNPVAAAMEFAATHPEYEVKPPAWRFNESELAEGVTYWPGAWLRRKV